MTENFSTKSIQHGVMENKIKHGFNTTDMNKEFLLLYGEVAEAWDAYRKSHAGFAEELADIAIYLLGIAEMDGIDLGNEIIRKMKINEKRVYKKYNGAMVEVKPEPEYPPFMADYFMDGEK